jgi:glycosyltransferase involved in cell wall biosynthesis
VHSETSIAAPALEAGTTRTAACPPARLALLCDFIEEGWPSMDLFGDMLAGCFARDHAAELSVEQLRPPLHPRFSRLPMRRGAPALWNADRLINRFFDYPRWLKKQAARFDLFHLIDHSYGQLAAELPSGSVVTNCHDLDTFRCLLEPKLEPRPRWFRRMAQRTLHGFLRCAHVISISASTRSQLLSYGLFPPDRVTVIPPGVDPVFFAEPSSQAPDGIAGAAGRTCLLHVGSTIRRKRIDVLLRTFAGVSRAFPNLVLCRVGGPFTAEQLQLATELGVADKIVHSARLTKEQLALAYQNAALLLQTSDAEGFGLPVIEAMARGCVVAASDIAPLREAGGSAAEYCTAADIPSWIATVTRLLQERETAPDRWEIRKRNARRHASAFTWTENANRTIDVYRRVLKASGRHPTPLGQ